MRKQTIKIVQAFLRGQACNGATCKTKRANREGLVDSAAVRRIAGED